MRTGTSTVVWVVGVVLGTASACASSGVDDDGEVTHFVCGSELCVTGQVCKGETDSQKRCVPRSDASADGMGGAGSTGDALGGTSSGGVGAGGIASASAAAGTGGSSTTPTSPACSLPSSPDLAYPASEMPFGVSLSEWGERWFQWTLGLPKTDHPSYGGPCDQGQGGPAWFLGTPRPGSSTRDCTVPTDTGIMVTAAGLIMVETADLPEDNCAAGQCPYPEDGYRQLCLDQFPSLFDSVCVEVNGVSVANMDDYYVTTGVFRAAPDPSDPLYPLEQSGPYGPNTCPGDCAEGTDRHWYRCGYWMMLKPLSAGSHTVRIFSIAPEDPANPGVQDSSEVTYRLTVE